MRARSNNASGIATRYVANNRGIALVITLFVVALVTVLVLEYYFDASVDIDLAENYAQDLQAYHLAMSGVHFARALLRRDDRQVDGPEDLWYKLGLIPTCIPPQQMLSLTDAEGTVFSSLAGTQDVPASASDEEGCVRLQIIDEQSKLPINALKPAKGSQDPNPTWLSIFDQFFASFQMDQDLLNALIDWLDQDDVPRGLGGAEKTYYEGLDPPYEAQDGPMRTPGELRLVRGFDAETLAKLFPGLPPEAMVDVDLGSNNYLTVFGADQEAKVNLNTANAEVLQALLAGLEGEEGSTVDVVEEIIAKRQEAQFKQLTEVSDLLPEGAVRAKLPQVADVKSRYFRVESTGRVEVIRKKVVAILKRDQQGALSLVYIKVE